MERIVYSDGTLEVFKSGVVRENFSAHHSTISTVADFKATLRAGAFAWPGGYPLFFVCSDGGALSFASARKNARQIMEAIRDNDRHSDWRVMACEINWEDQDLHCDHSGERIPSAYAEDEAESAQ